MFILQTHGVCFGVKDNQFGKVWIRVSSSLVAI